MFSKSYQDQLNALPMMQKGLNLQETGFVENQSAAFDQFIREDLSISRVMARSPYIDENIKAYTESTGEAPPTYAIQNRDFSADDIELFIAADRGDEQAIESISAIKLKENPFAAYNTTNTARAQQSATITPSDQLTPHSMPRQATGRDISGKYAAWRWWNEQADLIPSIKNHQQISTEIANELAIKRKEANEIFSRANGWGQIGQFSGIMGGAITDPINIATLGFSTPFIFGKGATTSARLAAVATEGFVVNAATEVVIQPFVYDFKQEIDSQYSINDAITNIVAAGVGGSLLSSAGYGAKAFKNRYGDEIIKGLKRLNRKVKLHSTLESRATAKIVDELVTVLEDTPFKGIDNSVEGIRVHLNAFAKAQDDFRQGHWPDTRQATRVIDDAEGMSYVRLQQFKQTLAQEAQQAISKQDTELLSKQLNEAQTKVTDLNTKLENIKQLGEQAFDIKSVAKEISTSNKRLPARKIKTLAQEAVKERKSFIAGEGETKITAINKEQAKVKSKLDKNSNAARSAKLLDEVEAMQARGTEPTKIINKVSEVRPDLINKVPQIKKAKQPLPATKEIDLVKLETPTQTRQRRQEQRQPQQEVATTAKAPNTEQKLKSTYYDKVEGVSEYFDDVYRDVELRLKEDDTRLFTGDDEISAREYIAQADEELQAAADLKGCLLG